MARIQVELTIEVEVEYIVASREPDVGIMHPYVSDTAFYNPTTGRFIDLSDVLTDKQFEYIYEQCLEDYQDGINN